MYQIDFSEKLGFIFFNFSHQENKKKFFHSNFTQNKKLNEDLRVQEFKPTIVNQQCVVHRFQCNMSDAGYVGCTRGHLHECFDGHKQKSSSTYKYYFNEHNATIPARVSFWNSFA